VLFRGIDSLNIAYIHFPAFCFRNVTDRFARKMSFHYSAVNPAVSDRSESYNGKHPLSPTDWFTEILFLHEKKEKNTADRVHAQITKKNRTFLCPSGFGPLRIGPPVQIRERIWTPVGPLSPADLYPLRGFGTPCKHLRYQITSTENLVICT